MTVKFLSQSPSAHETTDALRAFLAHDKGTILLLTGGFGSYESGTSASEMLSLMEWAAAKPKQRKIVILVGVFENKDTDSVTQAARKLAYLMINAEKTYLQKTDERMDIPMVFMAVNKWHAKAIALFEPGKDFYDAKCAIFGSTNFSDSALGGANFELDLFMDNQSPEGITLLRSLMLKLKALVDEGLKNQKVRNFHKTVEEQIAALGRKGMCTPDAPDDIGKLIP